MGGLVAFFVGAVFLDLIIFEPFYFVLMLITANYSLVKKQEQTASEQAENDALENVPPYLRHHMPQSPRV